MSELVWRVEKRLLKDLKFWDKNPRKISEDNYNRLVGRIRSRGFHDVLKVDENNTVLSGNQRLKALLELGYTEVECKIPNRKLTGSEKDLVGLESNFSDGETDFNLLSENFDIDLLHDVGFSDVDINSNLDVTPDIVNVDSFATASNFFIRCEDLDEVDRLKDIFGVTANSVGFKTLIMKLGV